jgi:hypothetical protein
MRHRFAIFAAVLLGCTFMASAQDITGSGTNGYILKFNGATTATNSRIFQDGNGVGVNTRAPRATLDVNGSVNAATGFNLGGTPFAFGSATNYNAFLGFAGNSTTNNTATQNTAVGVASFYSNTTGVANTAIGSYALYYNTTGGGNTAVGNSSGNFIYTGYFNTFLGVNTGAGGDLTNATAIGANTIVSESNALILGGTGANAVTVGIGTQTPYNDYALDVEALVSNGIINGGVVSNASGGNIYLGMTNTVHKFRVDTNGAVYADGGLFASGADFSESVEVRGDRAQYEPGDVLAIDRSASRHLALSHHSYETLVAGIYSTKPGVLASPHHIDDPSTQTSEVPLAVVGIVPCKVTTENGAIQPGDLLVTSSRPGYAMKGTDRKRLVGAVVGKALEPLSAGTGKIQILVTLQ